MNRLRCGRRRPAKRVPGARGDEPPTICFMGDAAACSPCKRGAVPANPARKSRGVFSGYNPSTRLLSPGRSDVRIGKPENLAGELWGGVGGVVVALPSAIAF